MEKTRDIINAINKMFQAVYVPEQNISIDESTIAYKGNCRTKVYNPAKPDKWGLQLKVLCDSKSHYVYSMKFWDGEKNSLYDVMTFLLIGLENSNYHLFTDNLYNSYDTTKKLLEKGIYLTGTLRRRRGGPELMNIKKIPEAQRKTILPFSKNNINAFLYNDSKLITIISSYYDIIPDEVKTEVPVIINNNRFNGIITKNTPIFINSYNKYMGGVDCLDQELKYYNPQRRTNRWTFKLSLYLIQVILFNSFVIYQENNSSEKQKLTHLEYNLSAIEWFCGWKDPNFTNSEISNLEIMIQEENKGDETDHNDEVLYNHSSLVDYRIHRPRILTKHTSCSLCYKSKKNNQTYWYCDKCKKDIA